MKDNVYIFTLELDDNMFTWISEMTGFIPKKIAYISHVTLSHCISKEMLFSLSDANIKYLKFIFL
jgi:hypothetical protein